MKAININIKNASLIITGLCIAMALFYYGINVPLQLRLRGDAFGYLNIAQQFSSLSQSLNYVGDRTPGFPWFIYLFQSILGRDATLLTLTNDICITLVITHLLTSFWVCYICIKSNLIKISSIYFGLLFTALATYPAFVLHTTLPLTDTFGMDLLLIGFSLFVWASNDSSLSLHLLFLGIISGLFIGYAILVRPAYWVGVLAFILIYGLIAMINQFLLHTNRSYRPIMMLLIFSLTLAMILLPIIHHCNVAFHSLCIQSPSTFPLLDSITEGLKGGRVIWNHPSAPAALVPVYPDPFMMKNFHDRCPISSVVGPINSDNSNLLSCMFHAPHLTIIFFIKKLIALFDSFRMTPYTELVTPEWYIWLGRLFSSMAFVGFWILLWNGMTRAYQLIIHRQALSPLFTAIWAFCIIQTSTQIILHVEERYAFPWIPFCIIALILKIKFLQEENNTWMKRIVWLSFILIVITIYMIQVIIWDKDLPWTYL